MSIKKDEPDEGWRSPKNSDSGKAVKRESSVTLSDPNAEARESARQSEAEREAQRAERTRQITAAIGNQNESRVKRLEEIAARADEQEDRKTVDFDGESLVEDETEASARRAEEEAQAERERLEAEANERAAQEEQHAGAVHAEPKKFKLKVNGQERELTEDELIALGQKVASADEYLKIAAEAVKASQARALSQDEPASVEKVDTRAALRSAIQGDEEAIEQVAQRLEAPSAVTPDVLKAVDDRMSFHSAVTWFRGEYKDIVDDPDLYRMAAGKDAELAKADPSLSYQQRLKQSGEYARSVRDRLTKSATPPNPKLERKASVTPIPQAGGRQVVKEDTEEDEPIESIIDQMARARHQAGAIRK